MTAGVSSKSLEELEGISLTYPNLGQKLKEDYLLDNLLDLREDEAKSLISDIKSLK